MAFLVRDSLTNYLNNIKGRLSNFILIVERNPMIPQIIKIKAGDTGLFVCMTSCADKKGANPPKSVTPVAHPNAVPLYLLEVAYKDTISGAQAAAAAAPIILNIISNKIMLVMFKFLETR